MANYFGFSEDMLGEGWSKYLDPTETATSEYSRLKIKTLKLMELAFFYFSDISPVILAAHMNQFEILQMLLRKDANIEKPHKHYWFGGNGGNGGKGALVIGIQKANQMLSGGIEYNRNELGNEKHFGDILGAILPFSSACEICEEERINDGLHRSLKRINTYRALASPAWISLTSSDPILSAFKLSRELQKRAKVEDEFKARKWI